MAVVFRQTVWQLAIAATNINSRSILYSRKYIHPYLQVKNGSEQRQYVNESYLKRLMHLWQTVLNIMTNAQQHCKMFTICIFTFLEICAKETNLTA